MPNFRDGMGKTDALMIRIARWASPIGRLAINQARRQAERAPEKFSGQFDKELSPPDVAVHREAGMREAVRVAFLESTRHGARGIIEDYRIWSAPTGLDYTKVHCPARLWHGDADAVVPVHHASYVAALIPDAELEVMPGVGHLHTAARSSTSSELASHGWTLRQRFNGLAPTGPACGSSGSASQATAVPTSSASATHRRPVHVAAEHRRYRISALFLVARCTHG